MPLMRVRLLRLLGALVGGVVALVVVGVGVRAAGFHGAADRQGSAVQAVCSSASSEVAFSDFDSSSIDTISVGGAHLRRLTHGQGFKSDGNAAWSPDGTWIAFDRSFETSGDIYVVRADGSGQRRLTRNGGGVVPSWSPDGKRLYFFETVRGARIFEIDREKRFVINADGSGRRRLPPSSYVDAWSPDGRQFAVVDAAGGITLVNADGSGRRQVVGSGGGLAWSPDGSRIAFFRRAGPYVDEIEVVNVDGSGLTQLVRVPSDSSGDLTWSPDGKQLAYVGGPLGHPNVYVVNADGSGRRLLLRGDSDHGVVFDPSWSPDGRWISLTRGEHFTGGHQYDVWLIKPDGSGLHNLTKRVLPSDGSDGAVDGAWRPCATPTPTTTTTTTSTGGATTTAP